MFTKFIETLLSDTGFTNLSQSIVAVKLTLNYCEQNSWGDYPLPDTGLHLPPLMARSPAQNRKTPDLWGNASL